MPFLNLKERHLTFTGTATKTLMTLPAGSYIQCYGCRVLTVAGGAMTLALNATGVGTLMATAEVAPLVLGFKRNTTAPTFIATASNIEGLVTGGAGSPEVIFYCAVLQVVPGAGEI